MGKGNIHVICKTGKQTMYINIIEKNFLFTSNQRNQIEALIACHILLPIKLEKNRKDNTLC